MRHDRSVTATNHYLYNGKELNTDLGLDWYDYGFRWYDAELGRFPSLDPIADRFPFVSPFNYAENMPTIAIDLHGLQAYVVISGQKNPGPTPNTQDRGFDNKYIRNNGDAIANELGYSKYTYYKGVQYTVSQIYLLF